jgi:hypothetical protein
MAGKVMLIVNEFLTAPNGESAPVHEGDQALKAKLEKLGFEVELTNFPSANESSQGSTLDTFLQSSDKLLKTEVIFISSTAVAETDHEHAAALSDKLRDLPLPIMVLGHHLMSPMGMCRENDIVYDSNGSNSVWVIDDKSMMAAGLRGVVTVSATPIKYSLINLNKKQANPIVALNEDGKRLVLFGYRTGAKMRGNGIAPARRVGMIFMADIVRDAKESGWLLFEGAINWIAKALAFADIFRGEWREIRTRRIQQELEEETNKDRPPKNLVGLALSGGGIRSATFSLGLLQGLYRKNMLRIFDYLSTVSGGGYVGGWWSAWLSREPSGQTLFPKSESIEPRRISKYLKGQDKLVEGSFCASEDPVHHLRLFSNYLTPRKGILSSDTWQAVAMMARNLLLTWVVLLPVIFTFVLLGQFYFVLQKDSVQEFLRPFETEKVQVAQALKDLPVEYQQERDDDLLRRELQLRKLEDQNLPESEFNKQKSAIQKAGKKQLDALGDTERELTELFSQRQIEIQADYRKALLNRLITASFLVVPLLFWLLATTVFWLRVNITPRAIDKVTNAIPAVIFWVLIISVICLSTTLNWGDLHNPFQILKTQLSEMAIWKTGLIALSWLTLSAVLWWMSLPFVKNKGERLTREYPKGNLISLLMTSTMTFLLFTVLIVLHRMVRNGIIEGKFFWLPVMVIAVSGCLWFYSLPRHEDKWEWRKLVHGNRIMRLQSVLTVSLVGVVLVLGLSGYGYEIAEYLLSNPKSQQFYLDYLAKAGGWATVIASIAGSIFTAIKHSPTGGEDKHQETEPTKLTKVIVSATPPLVLICLAVAFAWLSRWMLIQFNTEPQHFVEKLQVPIVVCIALYLFLAVYEMRAWEKVEQLLGVVLSILLVAGICLFILFSLFGNQNEFTSKSACWSPFCYTIGGIGAAVGGLIFMRIPDARKMSLGPFVGGVAILLLVLFSLLANKELFVDSKLFAALKHASVPVSVVQSSIFFVGLISCGVVVLWERWFWDGNTKRTIFLTSFTYAVLAGFLLITFFADYEHHASLTMGYLALGLVLMSLSLSVALGWLSDPNMLSLHMFYKSRLMRAYLGASNPNRKSQEISESATGDDVLLRELKNCQRGAPFHLINTTLNLVGGKDLATAQRSSDYFVFSKLFAGSSRTGYRRNLPDQYLQGQMTLGTAVAISGAAVSPNMGAKTQTSAVAMLLTLLNVRLGFWAPTPNRRLWRNSQAGLWPFYILKEFLSQTNDLSSYCYLTDGGHFDNTGLYSLIERGCLYIIVADNGADRNNRFEDLGEAIRRCRIDFKAEIDLDVTPLFAKQDEVSGDYFAQKNHIVGTITYDKDHLRELGWNAHERRMFNQGVIIVIKPSLVEKESVDLRQYMRQNKDFPQQGTSDLWYDEAQFESYRKLGEWCAQTMIQQLELDQCLNGNKPLSSDLIKYSFENALRIYHGDKPSAAPEEEPAIPISPFLDVAD